MSESAAAAPSGNTSSAAAPQTTGAPAGNTPEGKAGQVAGKATAAPEGAEGLTQEELEEIKIGSTSAKLPKALAKTIKDLERGFHSKAQEAAQFRQFAKAAKENPDFFFEQFGIDPDQYSQSRLAKKLELEMMDPSARKAMELEQKLKQYEEAEKKQKEDQEREKLTRAEQEADRRLRAELMTAVKDKPLIGNDPHMIARVAAMMAASEEQQLGWTWEDCVAKVDGEIRNAFKSVIGNLDPEAIQALLGDEPLKKWREFDVKRVTQKAAPKSGTTSKGPGSSASKQHSTGAKKALSESEYREHFARLARGE